MVLLGAYAGLRRTEIAALHTSSYANNWLTITGKGRTIRHIPVHPALKPYLELKTSGYYFPGRFKGHKNHDYIAKRIKKNLGGKYTTHNLRHWFATTTYAKCKDIRVVQELLGHADIVTTQSYIGINDQALTQAVYALTDLPVPLPQPNAQ